jgi:hypothetical protein
MPAFCLKAAAWKSLFTDSLGSVFAYRLTDEILPKSVIKIQNALSNPGSISYFYLF